MRPTAMAARQASHLTASTSRCCGCLPPVTRSRRRNAIVVVRASSPSSPQSPPPPPPPPAAAAPQQRRPGPGPGPRPGAPPLPPGTIMGPDGTPLKVVKVEDTGADAWASVAAIDRGEGDGGDGAAAGRAALLAAGDLAALLAFAAVGRTSHGEPLDPSAVLATAGPFLAAWFPAALALGGYSPRAAGGGEGGGGGGGTGGAAVAALKVWAVAVPIGIVIRSLVRGYAPPNVFVAVTLGVTLVAMVGWRTALAALAPPAAAGGAGGTGGAPSSPAQQLAARKDRRGGPMELVQVIMSLTKRW